MKLRKRYLPVAAMLGAAVVIVPAFAASPSEVKLEVNENCVEPNWPCWAVPGSGPNPEPASKVTIAPGGEIKFADKASTAAAVTWKGSAPMCSGLPASATTAWEGTCKFEQEGTYMFESATMFKGLGLDYTKYEIVVGNTITGTTSTTGTTTTTTTPTTTTPTTTTPTTTTPTTTTPTITTPVATTSTQPSGGGTYTAMTPGSTETPPPPVGSHSLATVAIANAQHGDAVHGTVQIPAADGGARLEVEVLTRGASLASVKRPSSTRVGRLVRSSAPAGKVSFTVALDAAAKSVLRHKHKLALTVKIVLTPKHGAALTITRSLALRP
ncbi:MAG TPA: hypothetical protein VIH71_07735 [Solirubrobacteraceae bacterium]